LGDSKLLTSAGWVPGCCISLGTVVAEKAVKEKNRDKMAINTALKFFITCLALFSADS
jgi:hypothetical protein